MAFSARMHKAVPKAATSLAPRREDSDEVESVDGDQDKYKAYGKAREMDRSAELARIRRMREAEEDEARAKAERRERELKEEAARRRRAAEGQQDARLRAQEEALRRQAFEEEKARQETIAQSKREAARRATGAGRSNAGFGAVPPAGFGGSAAFGSSQRASDAAEDTGNTAGGGSFAWKKSGAAEGSPQQQGLSFGKKPGEPSSGLGAGAARSAGPGSRPGQSRASEPGIGAGVPIRKVEPPKHRDLPSHDDCELGISAMISRTHNGMKEGLQLLGLPNYPLVFVAGQELKLCGHNVREAVNEMIHAWMTDEKDEFYHCLVKIRGIVARPILTEEEVQMMEQQEQWEKSLGPDGKPRYMQRDHGPPQADDDDDDDEVIDVTPGVGAHLGNRPVSGAQGTPAAPSARGSFAAGANTVLGPGSAGAGSARGVGSFGASPEAPARGTFGAARAVPTDEDYYGLLGVDPGATLQEIRTKFRALVVTEHPEKGGDPKKFQKLNKAYSVLSDQKKRQEYDASHGF